MSSSNNNKYFLGYRLNNMDGWEILNRSFCTNTNQNNIIGQFFKRLGFAV